MVKTLIMVASGGALGASLRYLLGVAAMRLFGAGFPLGTLLANLIGSCAMGAFVVLAAQRGLSHMAPLVMTGLLGGFTTFSAFSLDVVTLYERGEMIAAMGYAMVSVVGAIAALMFGMWMMREGLS